MATENAAATDLERLSVAPLSPRERSARAAHTTRNVQFAMLSTVEALEVLLPPGPHSPAVQALREIAGKLDEVVAVLQAQSSAEAVEDRSTQGAEGAVSKP